MKTQNISFVLWLLGVALVQPSLATEYGCRTDDPAAQLATDYNRHWDTTVKTGNAERLAELYADNAILMPPTDETIVGNGPIGSYLTSQEAGEISDYSIDLVACDLSGDMLQFAGVWGGNQTDYSGRPIAMTGNVLRILDRQTDGSWALRYEIWN